MNSVKRMRQEPCDFCDGHLEARTVSVVRGRARKLVMIEQVPALVCTQCGMRYFDAPVVRSMERLLKRSRSTKRKIQIPVTKYETVA